MARHYWLATGHPDKYKVVSLEGGYHGVGDYALFVVPIVLAPSQSKQPAPPTATSCRA